MTIARARLIALAVSVFALAVLPARALADEPDTLTQLQFDIVGIQLRVDPPALTVPKNIATIVNADLTVPAGAAAGVEEAIASFKQGAQVLAELRGPSIPPVQIAVKAGQPIPIPPLALPGDYFLDQIRLVKNDEVVLSGTPDIVPIKVISEVFVTSVTSRPLSLDEIQAKGIVIDESNFQAINFELAFNIDNIPFKIDLPVALPSPELLRQRPTEAIKLTQQVNQRLQDTQVVELPPELQRPGLSFSIAALPFFPADPDEDDALGFDVQPITGILFIPGNIAFLNQFFSVQLIVMNVAPDGSALVLRDVEGEIILPTGLDRKAGTFDDPGDDPLRLARIEGIGQQSILPVVQSGTDKTLGTADDIPTIPPLASGEAEFLVEGLKEGSHTLDIAINAVLDGLPSGPVELTGQAVGLVLVRNPTFDLTLGHPRTVRSGEPYDLFATITNTSLSPANFVSVNLDPRSISGAQLVSEDSVVFETLGPGESGTARFRLVAQQTGDVTASSFTAGEGISGSFQLRTGIGERGVPLAPNVIVLPQTADELPPDLVFAAQRVLGQALSIANAPAGALPPDVLFVSRQTVIERGQALAEAGQRLQFGDTLPRAVQDLLLDWMGNTSPNDGF
ncbi:MAG: hypothetical protein L0177_03510, partial [Chloroflexi bacterium]|nr:hypothetical protein [Chloroflexota bacterium]